MSAPRRVAADLPVQKLVRELGLPDHPRQSVGTGHSEKAPTLQRVRSAIVLSGTDMAEHIIREPPPRGTAGDNVPSLLATARDLNGTVVTVSMFIGRWWERRALEIKFVQERLAKHLNHSLSKQRFFLNQIYDPQTHTVVEANGEVRQHGGTVFFDANGDHAPLTKKGLADLRKQLREIERFETVEPNSLARAGIKYADRFQINGVDYVDGAFLLPVGDRYIVLLRVEAKTVFSKGIDAQLGAFFVRLASSGGDETITCFISGKQVELARTQLLFNPVWVDAGVGIQEFWYDAEVWADARQRKSGVLLARSNDDNPGNDLPRRIEAGTDRASSLAQPTAFLTPGAPLDLETRTSSAPIIYARMPEVRQMSWWLEDYFSRAQKR